MAAIYGYVAARALRKGGGGTHAHQHAANVHLSVDDMMQEQRHAKENLKFFNRKLCLFDPRSKVCSITIVDVLFIAYIVGILMFFWPFLCPLLLVFFFGRDIER